jgi:hypothetical protein
MALGALGVEGEVRHGVGGKVHGHLCCLQVILLKTHSYTCFVI